MDGAPQDIPGIPWIRAEDDNGGGDSATNHLLLLFQGTLDDARAAIRGLGADPDSSSPEYGRSIGFSEHSDFASATWFERGCRWEHAASRHREEPGHASWRPFIEPGNFFAQCETSLDRARARAASWRPDRQVVLACPRVETLALALLPPPHPWSEADFASEGQAERARELCALAGRPDFPADSPNAALASHALFGAILLAAESALVASPWSSPDEPDPWLTLAEMACPRGLGWLCSSAPPERAMAALAASAALACMARDPARRDAILLALPRGAASLAWTAISSMPGPYWERGPVDDLGGRPARR